jgi:sugar/nucleoside kinase (ribokinase family)
VEGDASTLDLLTVGESFEDLVFYDLRRLPAPGEEMKTRRFAHTFGGGALITAVAAARLGLRCRVATGLSADAVRRLRRETIGISNMLRPGEPHAVTAALSTSRERSFATFEGANPRLEARYSRALRGRPARHVHFAFSPRHPRRWRALVRRLRKAGVTTSWDAGWNESLADDHGFLELLCGVDYALLNESEARLYSRRRSLAGALRFFARRSRNTIVKLGPRGCRWVGPRVDLAAEAPRVRSIDTTGAGDAWNGGFLSALLRGQRPIECLRLANRVGALSTRQAGGIDGLPSRRELR